MSSTVSCSKAAHSVASVMPSSARMVVTASGCVMKASPLLRVWPSCSRFGPAVCALDETQVGLRVIGADDAKQRIERGRLWSTGTEARDALTHPDALLRRAGAGLGAGAISLGLGDNQSAARLMGDVASRPRRLGVMDGRPYGRPVIAHSAFLPQQNAILDNELLRPAHVRAYGSLRTRLPASAECSILDRCVLSVSLPRG